MHGTTIKVIDADNIFIVSDSKYIRGGTIEQALPFLW